MSLCIYREIPHTFLILDQTLFIVSLLTLQHIENCNAQECFQSKDVKKWLTDANFQTLASTGRKAEMASANTDYVKATFHMKPVKIFRCYAEDLISRLRR